MVNAVLVRIWIWHRLWLICNSFERSKRINLHSHQQHCPRDILCIWGISELNNLHTISVGVLSHVPWGQPFRNKCLLWLKSWRRGPGLNMNSVFSCMVIPFKKIKCSRDRLIFKMGIPLLVRQRLYIETVPRFAIQTPIRNACHTGYCSVDVLKVRIAFSMNGCIREWLTKSVAANVL